MKVDGVEPAVLQRIQEQARQKRVERFSGAPEGPAVKRSRQTLGQQKYQPEDYSYLERLQKEVDRLNDTARIYNIGLRFSIHQETERLVVQVYDRRDNEVIREIPPEKVLNLVAQIQQMIGLLLDEQR
ncbi:MAG TPA: flagellar protein FlaG [Firmicutes bacterium]|nr:flagellar protein FlaG [Bacillota bacterium]